VHPVIISLLIGQFGRALGGGIIWGVERPLRWPLGLEKGWIRKPVMVSLLVSFERSLMGVPICGSWCSGVSSPVSGGDSLVALIQEGCAI
jgi:hypothetical protein